MNGYPQNAETPLELLTEYITPISLFFVRSHWIPHTPDLKSWRLTVDGDVERPLTLTLADLKRLPRAEATCVLQCAGNGRALHDPIVPGVQWRYGAVGDARWRGARVKDVLDRAGVLAWEWIVRLSPQAQPQPGFYMDTAYRYEGKPLTEIFVKSNIITAPKRATAGKAQAIRGFAFSGAPRHREGRNQRRRRCYLERRGPRLPPQPARLAALVVLVDAARPAARRASSHAPPTAAAPPNRARWYGTRAATSTTGGIRWTWR